MNSKKPNLPEDLFATIVDNTMDSVIVFDSAGHVWYWNRTAQLTLGFSDDSYGRSVFDLIADSHERQQLKADFERFHVEGTSQHACKPLEIKATRSDGSNIWVDFCWTNFETDQGPWAFAVLGNLEQRKQKELRLQQEATTDFLSGIGNRRQFQHVLESKSHLNICLGIIDIDHFKRINDQFGHLVGDQGIRFVAKYLMKNFQSAACVARLGGEEFGVVMEVEDSEDARHQFEAFRRDIESQTFSEHQIKLTVSIGLATSFDGQFDSHKLVALADHALFTSKKLGRNQVRMAEAVLIPR